MVTISRECLWEWMAGVEREITGDEGITGERLSGHGVGQATHLSVIQTDQGLDVLHKQLICPKEW